jgi:hypothetical protein
MPLGREHAAVAGERLKKRTNTRWCRRWRPVPGGSGPCASPDVSLMRSSLAAVRQPYRTLSLTDVDFPSGSKKGSGARWRHCQGGTLSGIRPRTSQPFQSVGSHEAGAGVDVVARQHAVTVVVGQHDDRQIGLQEGLLVDAPVDGAVALMPSRCWRPDRRCRSRCRRPCRFPQAPGCRVGAGRARASGRRRCPGWR